MNNTIATHSEIKAELIQMQKFLEIELSEDAQEAVVRGNTLTVYMARSGKLLADAKILHDRKLRSDIIEQIKSINSMAPSVAVKFTNTLVENESYLVNWATRINASCTHQLDWCRTLISKAKAEMQAFNN
ncbi:MAG TPA: hypothetical protein VF677_05815 [Flavobacterium sp.]|jgi:hypothetical protein